jgi:hypothetical protein
MNSIPAGMFGSTVIPPKEEKKLDFTKEREKKKKEKE